jgi:hypothetical protein
VTGGRPVAGAVQLQDTDDHVGRLHAGEVIELRPASPAAVGTLVERLDQDLVAQHLSAVPVAQLLHDAGSTV